MRYISTSDTNITFTDVDGKVMVVPKNRVYTHFNVDTVTFLLIERYDNEGICIFTTMAEDLEINGTTYTYEQLLDGEGISDLFSPTGLSFEVVEKLPETGSDGVIYLVPNGEDSYTEYLWIADEQRYEILGDVGDIDLRNYYTKSEVDEKLDLKANASDVYTKTEADNKFLTEHQSLANYYTKDEVYNKTESDAKYATQVVVNEEIASRIQGDADINAALGTKADKLDTYTKTQVDDALALKQDVSSAFSGDYDDLTNKPDLSVYAESADLATVATSGSYDDLSNKPAIPDTSDFVTKAEYNPKEIAIAEALTDLNENKADKTELPDVSTFATKTEVNTALSAKADKSDTYTKTQTDAAIQTAVGQIDLSDYQTKEDADVKEEVISTALNTLNTSKADASSVYTKSEIDAMVGNINTILASI